MSYLLKKISKKAFLFLIILFGLFSFVIANNNQYIFYYGDGCSHCAKVENFFEENNIVEKYNVKLKEVYNNSENRKEMLDYGKKLNIELSKLGVPFLIINNKDECKYVGGDKDIIAFFQAKLNLDKEEKEICEETGKPVGTCNNNGNICNHKACGNLNCEKQSLDSGMDKLNKIKQSQNKIGNLSDSFFGFLGIMLPAALADSINPCAFAVMLILLGSILQVKKKKLTVILSGLLFSLAIFLSYLLMGLGVMHALTNSFNTEILKRVVGGLGIFIGLANLKDVFRYGKGFVMEVPFSRRPKMQKLIKSVTSPIGVFFIGILVSLFLLPCTSGPYLTILGFLSKEGTEFSRGLIYILIYNLIFILPMLIITFLVGLGYSKAETLSKIKNKHNKTIHLIVGLLMLGLGLYVILFS